MHITPPFPLKYFLQAKKGFDRGCLNVYRFFTRATLGSYHIVSYSGLLSHYCLILLGLFGVFLVWFV